MKITLVGMGSGLPGSLTAQGLQALQTAGLILGAKRLLQNLPDGCTPNRKPIYLPDEVLACLQAEPCQNAALVYSGDTGFYSGAAALVPKLRAQGAEVTVLPGISSVQLLAAALGRPWQNWHLVSAHGCACAPAAECRSDRPTFFLTGGRNTSPAALCEILPPQALARCRPRLVRTLAPRSKRSSPIRCKRWRAAALRRSACCWWSPAPNRSPACPACRMKPSSAAKRR